MRRPARPVIRSVVVGALSLVITALGGHGKPVPDWLVELAALGVLIAATVRGRVVVRQLRYR